jgi:hypothetical protein
MSRILFIVASLLGLGLLALPLQAAEETQVKKSSADNRADSHLSLFYLPLDIGLVLPTKRGFALSWIANEDLTIEAEYLSGSYGLGFLSVDLVSLSESLTTVRARYYPWNSLNFFAGFAERDYRFGVGPEIQDKIANYSRTELPRLSIKNQVLSLGVGNRWQFDNGITIGVDWFEWVKGIGRGEIDEDVTGLIKDPKYKASMQNVLNYMRYGSTFNALKVQLGYSF